MDTSRTVGLFLTCAVLVSNAVPQASPNAIRLADLSESGDVFRFEVAPGGTLLVSAPGAAAWEILDFEVDGAVAGETLRFRVSDPGGAFQPEVSFVAGSWEAASELVVDVVEGRTSFSVTPRSERFLVRLRGTYTVAAGGAPYYSYDDFVAYMLAIQSEPLAQVTQIGTSVLGRPLYRIVIDPPAPANPVPKRTFVTTWRQHGDEYSSSYVLEGLLDLLLGRSGLVTPPELLDGVRWIVYPLVNPDGAFLNQRYNANNVDLNRDWVPTGCTDIQEIETFTIQCDLEGLAQMWPIARGGDHHTWGGASTHGGFRYALGAPPSSVTTPQYEEARKDTNVVRLHDPTQFDWKENGGTPGMARVELLALLGSLFHTPEYSDSISPASELHAKGVAYAGAAQDFLIAPRFSDAAGAPIPIIFLPVDGVYVTVFDLDENHFADLAETLLVRVTDQVTGDAEVLTLVETGANTGVFRNPTALPLVLTQGAPLAGDGRLESLQRSTLIAAYVDHDYSLDASAASVRLATTRGTSWTSARLRPSGK